MKIVAKQLPSGSWRCQVTVDGTRKSVTRPTKREAEKAAQELMVTGKSVGDSAQITLGAAIDKYIESNRTLSPATLRGYGIIRRNRFKKYMNRKLCQMNETACQRMVDEEASLCSPKTLKNAWGFVRTVIKTETKQEIDVKLPKVVHEDEPWLEPEQIPIFLKAIKGTDIEIAALLGLSSLRRSEILAVTWDDIDLKHGTIQVHGAVVPNEHHKLILKETNKNETSRRTIPFILPQLREALNACPTKNGAVVTMIPETVRKHINRICVDKGLPEVSIHGLRRSFASLCYELEIPTKDCMAIGGWANDNTMLKIYTKISERHKNEQAAKFEAFFASQQ